MTREEYGQAYIEGHERTVRFLLSRGVLRDTAQDVAQAAWARGWEHLNQLRDESLLITWVNAIALNHFRRSLRYEQRHETLVDIAQSSSGLNWAAIELSRILSRCQRNDRTLLEAQLAGVTAKELSKRTGTTPTAIRLRFFRARHAARLAAQEPRASAA